MKYAFTLSDAVACDAPVLAALHASCFSDSWGEQSIANLLGRPHVTGFKATVNDACVVGFILNQVIEAEAEILTICVDPAWRRSGLGRVLLKHACERLRELGVASYFLEVSEENVAARRLYADAGFFEVGRRKAYYRSAIAGGGGGDALVLKRRLVE